MANYYVKPDGDDADNGLNIAMAWQHPSYAAQQAQAGDTIYLMDGTWYNEHVVFANSGIDGNPIIMVAYNSTATLDGMDGTGEGVTVWGHDYINIDGITVKNYNKQILIRAADHIYVSNCTAYPNSNFGRTPSGIDFTGCTYSTFDNCTVIGDAWNSIQLKGRYYSGGGWHGETHPIHHITIKNCVVYDNTLHGLIDFLGNIDHVTIENNTLGHIDYDSGGAIFLHQGVVTNLTITNNMIINSFYYADAQAVFLNNVKNGYIAGNHIYHTSTGLKVYHSDYGVDDYPENITFYDNEVHDCKYWGSFIYAGSNINFDHNLIYDTGTPTYPEYRFTSDGKILNQKGTVFSVRSTGGIVEITFTDGRTFSVDDSGEYTTYTITSGSHKINIFGIALPISPPVEEYTASHISLLLIIAVCIIMIVLGLMDEK